MSRPTFHGMFEHRLRENAGIVNPRTRIRESLFRAYRDMNNEYGQAADFDFMNIWQRAEQWMDSEGL